MTLLVTMETFDVLEVPLRLPGSIPFVLLMLQLQLGLSVVSCQVTKLPAFATLVGLAIIRGFLLFLFLCNLILSPCYIIISQSSSFHTGLWLLLFDKNAGILREHVQELFQDYLVAELVNRCAYFHSLTCKVFKPCSRLDSPGLSFAALKR